MRLRDLYLTYHQGFGPQDERENDGDKYVEGKGIITQIFTVSEARTRKEPIREGERRREGHGVYPV